MANVLIAVATVGTRIVKASVGPQPGRVVNAVTPGISILEIKPIREAVGNSCLKAVVVGVGRCFLVSNATENSATEGRIERIALIEYATRVSICSICAG